MPPRRLELVAPAGDFETALYAIDAGANAVYFGLPLHSARAAATNLTIEDVRRLKTLAAQQNAKIYAAINTVITAAEMLPLLRWVAELELASIDGVIIQDLGFAATLRTHFPTLPLHGSTQLGVHNQSGLTSARELGLRRVVLARELSLAEIADLAAHKGELELEVFVHGALCYGFSGLCLASSALTERSANRGACAQICRSWFARTEPGSENERGYYLSSKDLDAGPLLRQLLDTGIDALKIEGRMKSAAYAESTTRYYRALLDEDPAAAAHHRERSALAFSRPKSTGFLLARSKVSQVHPSYPSHSGIPGAVVLKASGRSATIRALTDLAEYDRLMRLPDGPPDRGTTWVMSTFAVNGKTRHQIAAGETAHIPGDPALLPGMELHKTHGHDLALRARKSGAIAAFRAQLPLQGVITIAGLRLSTVVRGKLFTHLHDCAMQGESCADRFEEIANERLGRFGDYPFCFCPITWNSEAGWPVAQTRMRPSELKRIRATFYQAVMAALVDIAVETSAESLQALTHALAPREAIKFPDGFPFPATAAGDSFATWPTIDNVKYIPLPPVAFSPAPRLDAIFDAIVQHPETRIAVGLNNVGHFAFAERLRPYHHVSFFFDYGLYTANAATIRLGMDHLPRFLGAYLWLEATASSRGPIEAALVGVDGVLPPGLRSIEHPEQFPLFISRVCHHQSLLNGPCPSGCPKRFTHHLQQNKKFFTVEVVDCLTYIFAR